MLCLWQGRAELLLSPTAAPAQGNTERAAPLLTMLWENDWELKGEISGENRKYSGCSLDGTPTQSTIQAGLMGAGQRPRSRAKILAEEGTLQLIPHSS